MRAGGYLAHVVSTQPLGDSPFFPMYKNCGCGQDMLARCHSPLTTSTVLLTTGQGGPARQDQRPPAHKGAGDGANPKGLILGKNGESPRGWVLTTRAR